MGLKGWFENKIALRKAEQEQRRQERQVATRYKAHRSSNHDASKKGYRHKHGAGFVTHKFILYTINKIPNKTYKTIVYKHGRNFGKKIPTNHERVTAKRNVDVMRVWNQMVDTFR